MREFFHVLDFDHFLGKDPGANPTIVSYTASAVKIYTTKSSIVRSESRNIFFRLEKTI
jgi:hypothetical protein